MLFCRLALLCILSLVVASPLPNISTTNDANISTRNTPLNNFLTTLLKLVPKFNGSISSLAGALTIFERFLADVTGLQTTYNQLGAGPCTPHTILFARGTTEPGNVGITVGPAMVAALESVIGTGQLTIQGVNDYSATVDGYLAGGDPAGSAMMANQIQLAMTLCPNTKLIVCGYSQGGQIVHNAAAMLTEQVGAWISSAIIFGDPDNGMPVANVPAPKTKVICHVGDDICKNGDLISVQHLTYALNVTEAAQFAVAAAAA